jgi:adenylate cyclase
MGLLDDLKNKISSYNREKFEIFDTTSLPDITHPKLTFGNTGLTGEFAFLFVDIRKSSSIVESYGFEKAAKIYQSFHEINVRIISANGGAVRAFDGDRIMGVFNDGYKNNMAVKAGMQIIWAIENILNPGLNVNISCGAGIDFGQILITKVGTGRDMNKNDLVWVGKATNYASHLSSQANNSVIVSTNSYGKLDDTRKLSGGAKMWVSKNFTLKNGQIVNCYETNYRWLVEN